MVCLIIPTVVLYNDDGYNALLSSGAWPSTVWSTVVSGRRRYVKWWWFLSGVVEAEDSERLYSWRALSRTDDSYSCSDVFSSVSS